MKSLLVHLQPDSIKIFSVSIDGKSRYVTTGFYSKVENK